MSNLEKRFAFDEQSPFSDQMSVLIDVDSETGTVSKLCMQSGFTTNNLMSDTKEFWNDLSNSYSVGFLFAFKDDKGTIWIPSAQATDLAALYPVREEGEEDIMKWHVTPINYLLDEEAKDYTTELDFDNTRVFDKLEYMQAFDLFLELSKLNEEEEEN